MLGLRERMEEIDDFDSGAPSPSRPRIASSKSPSASPCRYSSGSKAPSSFVRLANNGSTRLSKRSSTPRTRGRRRVNGSAPGTGEAKRSAAAPADPEVVDRPLRRRFSPSYKLRIVEEADRCTEPGEVGQVLRREGLYSSHLTTWRKAAHSGSLKALSKKRGRKPERNPLDEKVRKLERRNARLENELRKAHLIIDVQGKVAGLLGISLDDGTNS